MSANLSIELRPTGALTPYARKLRKHDQSHVERMIALLREFGFRIPLLIRSTGEIIDGHLRLLAAAKMNLAEVPVIVCDDWTETQVKAFRLAVNRSAAWSSFDIKLVALEIKELKALNFDLKLTAFDSSELDTFLFPPKENGGDSAAELAGEAITRPGDVWILGAHRILCGSSTEESAVKALLGSTIPNLMVTDPPYGVEYDPAWREQADLGHQRQVETVRNDDQVDWTATYRLFPGNVAYVWHAGVHAAKVATSLEAAGFAIRSQIIWAKQHFALSRGDYHWQHEPCWYAVREGRSSNWTGDRKQSTLWEVANLNPFGGDREEQPCGHATQKPVEVMRRPILNHTQAGDLVYDPFLGSGSTLMAAEATERVCYGIEIEPRYVDMAIARWEKASGKQAVLEGAGRTFGQIAEERAGGEL